MRHFGIPILAATLLLGGCGARSDFVDRRVARVAEHAQISRSPRTPACLAAMKADVHVVVRAVESGDERTITALLRDQRAFEADPSSTVVVEHEAFSERGVLITNGAEKGRRGWVPFEWLAPVDAGH